MSPSVLNSTSQRRTGEIMVDYPTARRFSRPLFHYQRGGCSLDGPRIPLSTAGVSGPRWRASASVDSCGPVNCGPVNRAEFHWIARQIQTAFELGKVYLPHAYHSHIHPRIIAVAVHIIPACRHPYISGGGL